MEAQACSGKIPGERGGGVASGGASLRASLKRGERHCVCPPATCSKSLSDMGLASERDHLVAYGGTILLQMRGDIVCGG